MRRFLLLAALLGIAIGDEANGNEMDLSKIDPSVALHVAAMAGRFKDLVALVKKRGDVNFAAQGECTASRPACGGATPLHMAVVANQIDSVTALLALRASVDSTDNRQATPLHLAASLGRGEIAQLLVQHDADMDLPDKLGNAAYDIAIFTRNTAVATLLLDAAAEEPRTKTKADELRAIRACVENLLPLPSERFYDVETADARPTISFLSLSPDMPEQTLARHGLVIIDRFDEPSEAFPAPRKVVHLPDDHWFSVCSSNDTTALGNGMAKLPASRLAIARIEGAMATFDGVIVKAGKAGGDGGGSQQVAVFAPSDEVTHRLQAELIHSGQRGGPYRLARTCPPTEDVRDDESAASGCCVAAASEAAAQLWLWPLIGSLARDESREGGPEHYGTTFLEGLSESVNKQLLSCEDAADQPPQAYSTASLLVWQSTWAGNYGHFLSESLPRLLRLIPFLEARPGLKLFFAGGQQFAYDAFRLLSTPTVDLEARTLPYDPCGVYHAEEMFTVLSSGRVLPSQATTRRLHSLWLRSIAAGSEVDGAADGATAATNAKPYVLLLDRSDAGTRMNKGEVKSSVPRVMINGDAVADAAQAVLTRAGVELRRFRAADMSFHEQLKIVSGARGLIGVHGAGLMNALALPAGAAVLEVLPALRSTPNRLSIGSGPANSSAVLADETAVSQLRDQCGFTQFWAAAGSAELRYYSLLMHEEDGEHGVHIPLAEVAQLVQSMIDDDKALPQHEVDTQRGLKAEL